MKSALNPILAELVVHLSEWTTGLTLFLTFESASAFLSWELVVHLPEWATSSMLFLAS